MENYFAKAKEVLKILINNGSEAYIIGEAVCNKILNLETNNIEIITNATPDMVKGIFNEAKVEDSSRGVTLKFSGYDFTINTFRLEEKFKDNRKPYKLLYSKKLEDELALRDYTINSITMTAAEKISDAYNGFKDIQKKRIRIIGNPNVRFKEDPLRMLIAIRLVSELGFNINNPTLKAIKKKSKLLLSLEIETYLDEVKRILEGRHFKKALKYLIDTKLFKRIKGLDKEFYRLSEKFRAFDIDSFLITAFVKKNMFIEEWLPMATNPEIIFKTYNLAVKNTKANYSVKDLFNNGLEICLYANRINHLLRKSKNKSKIIKRDFDKLAITNRNELAFSENDMIPFLSVTTSNYVDVIIEELLNKVLSRELENNFEILKAYALAKLDQHQKSNSYYDSAPTDKKKYYYETPPVAKKVELVEAEVESRPITEEKVQQVVHDYYQGPVNTSQKVTNSLQGEDKYQNLENKIKELEMNNLKIKLEADVNNIVGQNLEILKDMDYLEGPEKVMVSRELKKVYREIITEVDPKLRSLKESNKQEGIKQYNENEN